MEQILPVKLLSHIQVKVLDLCAVTAVSVLLVLTANTLPLQIDNSRQLAIANIVKVEIANVVGDRRVANNLETITAVTIDLLLNGILIDGYCTYIMGDTLTVSVSITTQLT